LDNKFIIRSAIGGSKIGWIVRSSDIMVRSCINELCQEFTGNIIQFDSGGFIVVTNNFRELLGLRLDTVVIESLDNSEEIRETIRADNYILL